MKTQQKSFITLLIIVVILIIAGGLYFSSSKKEQQNQAIQVGHNTVPSQIENQDSSLPNQISDWKKYSNTKYAIQFQYPQQYEILSSNSLPEYVGYFAKPDDTIITTIKMSNPQDLYPNTDLRDAFFAARITNDSNIDCTKKYSDDFRNLGVENIGGITFTKYNGSGVAAGTQTNITDYATYKNNTCYKFTTAIITSGYGAVEGLIQVNEDPISKDLHNIFSTLQFTTSLTSDWKVYSNANYGFQFQYPKDLNTPVESEDGTAGQYSIDARPLSITYYNPERNKTAKITLDNFTTTPWLHGPTDSYTEITVDGVKAVKYDLIIPVWPRGESAIPTGYDRWIQVGLQTPNGGFLEMDYSSRVLADKISAQKVDMSNFDKILSTFKFTK